MAKNLEMTATTINGPRGEFNLILHSAKSQRTGLCVTEYVVRPPTKVVLDLTELFHRQFNRHFLLLQRKISTKNLTSTISASRIRSAKSQRIGGIYAFL